MTEKYIGLEKYKDNGVKIVELLEELVSEMKLNNALLRQANSHDGSIPKEIKKDMILHELLKGRILRTRDVIHIIRGSKNTAIKYMTSIANDNKYILKNQKGNRGLVIAKRRC